nr:G-type lectin S-receptor-like serine/threonine-protein kinase LECRK3 [Tanacetum cinerariifolium]
MFPVLSRMAMDILTVQATSVASESAFSTSGRVLSIRRTRLTPAFLEMCMCLKYHLDAEERKQDKSTLETPVDFEEKILDAEVQANEAIPLSDEEIALDAASSERSMSGPDSRGEEALAEANYGGVLKPDSTRPGQPIEPVPVEKTGHIKPGFIFRNPVRPAGLAAQRTNGSISVGTSLTASPDATPWLSPSGEFAFGFRQVQGNENFLLSIWYDKIPDKTIVWYPRNGPMVVQGSKVELTNGLGLVLSDPTLCLSVVILAIYGRVLILLRILCCLLKLWQEVVR